MTERELRSGEGTDEVTAGDDAHQRSTVDHGQPVDPVLDHELGRGSSRAARLDRDRRQRHRLAYDMRGEPDPVGDADRVEQPRKWPGTPVRAVSHEQIGLGENAEQPSCAVNDGQP
jgi:hypothetical protein